MNTRTVANHVLSTSSLYNEQLPEGSSTGPGYALSSAQPSQMADVKTRTKAAPLHEADFLPLIMATEQSLVWQTTYSRIRLKGSSASSIIPNVSHCNTSNSAEGGVGDHCTINVCYSLSELL